MSLKEYAKKYAELKQKLQQIIKLCDEYAEDSSASARFDRIIELLEEALKR